MNIRVFATEATETFSAISRAIFLPELLLSVCCYFHFWGRCAWM